ncbi:hypothetical protein SFHH103_03922 [Sinorhizobium fredii HH103]|uniref:Competence protein CoiA nuclease-like domain-containing protein n=1 Tax=Sinorhizobium fredii (strain HH103) TaxID=1117943 RepID=G9A6A3_SINF1|nr:competence protein CoiA family protein [Sinorhizobium fredii]CCE98413.1 hypothetical protein SFHH103_03922 [Sinorhizobium fredii HH103]
MSQENSKARHLRMPCCEALVTLKRSRLGTKFFAHKAVGDCKWAPETEEHLFLKRLAVEVARASGWAAETEVRGETPYGEFWKADVLAEKGNHKVAVEIQWSGQTVQETLRRQERYRASGVRGLWLLRQPGFPISKRIPAVCIGGNVDQGLTALLPRVEDMQARDRRYYDRWHQVLSMEEFLRAAFNGRLRFGMEPDQEATVRIRTGTMFCRSCGAETRIVVCLEMTVADKEFIVTIPGVGEYPQAVEMIRRYVSTHQGIGAIKHRFSRTQRRKYLSNGCAHCDSLVGQFYELDADWESEPLDTFRVRVADGWKEVIDSCGWLDTWYVCP